MTATLDQTVYDNDGAAIEPGTLCWVKTTEGAPTRWRNNSRVLAVYCGDIGNREWLLLMPDERPQDYVQDTDRAGWRLLTGATYVQIGRLNLTRFENSHRGWWARPTDIEFIETALGYWCSEHVCFHAAETCPPEEPPAFDWAGRVATLERELRQARTDVEQARLAGEQALEDFKVRCSDILGSEASAHDLCGEYDRIASHAGLYPRVQDHEVEITVTYNQNVTVSARTYEDACDLVREASTSIYFEPGTPFADSDIECGSVYSVDVEVN